MIWKPSFFKQIESLSWGGPWGHPRVTQEVPKRKRNRKERKKGRKGKKKKERNVKKKKGGKHES